MPSTDGYPRLSNIRLCDKREHFFEPLRRQRGNDNSTDSINYSINSFLRVQPGASEGHVASYFLQKSGFVYSGCKDLDTSHCSHTRSRIRHGQHYRPGHHCNFDHWGLTLACSSVYSPSLNLFLDQQEGSDGYKQDNSIDSWLWVMGLLLLQFCLDRVSPVRMII